jgi:hypothetical protein
MAVKPEKTKFKRNFRFGNTMLSDFPIGHADQLKDRRDKEGLFLHSYQMLLTASSVSPIIVKEVIYLNNLSMSTAYSQS